MVILKNLDFQCRVSSVLNGNTEEFGKKYLFDDSEETCWNSDQGLPQWIAINLKEPKSIGSFEFQFQGGFAAGELVLEAGDSMSLLKTIETFYPKDINSKQIFVLKSPITSRFVRFLFSSSTDFFGRIVVYKLELFPPV